jgi:hypothetical protein
MKVNTAKEITPNDCRCCSWLKHWENYGDDFSMACSVEGCARPSEIGVEVQLDKSADDFWHIVPFCDLHNKPSAAFEIKSSAVLVSSNIESTCGK